VAVGGFFPESIVRSKPAVQGTVPRCGQCGLWESCSSPKFEVSGKGRLGVLIVGEAPDRDEDIQGNSFVGKAGQYLRRYLESIGIDFDRDCWATNAIICHPAGGRAPKPDEVDACRPNLTNFLKEYKPKVIIPLGGSAIRSVLSPFWKTDPGGVNRWVGYQIPLQRINSWVVPDFHPSFILTNDRKPNGPVTRLWFERCLKQAFDLSGSRPWTEVPDYRGQVELVHDPDEAAAIIREWCKTPRPGSFDYETTCLKPDADTSQIVSCAVSYAGRRTIAFPWAGAVKEAMSEWLQSPCPKIGANNKFEDRWTRAEFGHSVNNWVWDTMLSAHHLDNRPDTKSVEFQAFVRLGFEPWSGSMGRDLKTGSGSSSYDQNQLVHTDRRTSLTYNGLDALVEYLVAKHQKKEMVDGNAV